MLLTGQRIGEEGIPAGEAGIGQRDTALDLIAEPAALGEDRAIFTGGFKSEFAHVMGVDIAGIHRFAGIHRHFWAVAEADGVEGGAGSDIRQLEHFGDVAIHQPIHFTFGHGQPRGAADHSFLGIESAD